jgi:hypothetical protein
MLQSAIYRGASIDGAAYEATLVVIHHNDPFRQQYWGFLPGTRTVEAQHYGIVSYRAKRITTVAPARPPMLLMIFYRRPHSCEVAHVETKIPRVGCFAADCTLH